jgi:hypothetical protein
MERPRPANLADFRVAHLPVGKYIDRHIKVSGDEGTHSGIDAIKNLLPQSGVLLLDNHHSMASIVATGGFTLQTLEAATSIAPLTIKHHHGIFTHAIRGMNDTSGVEIITVARAEDMAKLSEDEQREMVAQNAVYETRMREAIATPYTTIVIAPFGTRARNVKDPEKPIRRGVFDLIQTGVPTFCADTSREPWHRTFTTAVSPAPLDFGKEFTRQSATQLIRAEQERLRSLRSR